MILVINRKSFGILSVVLVAFLLLSGCAENQPRNSSESVPPASKIISYCAREESAENCVFFGYPQFEESVSNAEVLNRLVLEFVSSELEEYCDGEFDGEFDNSSETWEWDEAYSIRAMNIGYEVVRDGADYFSVIFEGNFTHMLAAHPTNYFNALTIDVKRCEVVSLSDLCTVDLDFVGVFRSDFSRQIAADKRWDDEGQKSVEEYLDGRTDEEWLATLKSEARIFLTADSVGISVPMPHAIGDYFVVRIACDELKVLEK